MKFDDIIREYNFRVRANKSERTYINNEITIEKRIVDNKTVWNIYILNVSYALGATKKTITEILKKYLQIYTIK